MHILLAYLAFLLAATAPARGTISGVVRPVGRLGAVVWLEGGPPAPRVARPRITISQRGARFRPPLSVAVVGQEIAFPNDDHITHNVFSVSTSKSFDTELYRPGSKPVIRLERPGIVDLFCKIHEHMHATIVVVPGPHHARTDLGGGFSLGGVAPGKYRLMAYDPETGTASTELRVPAGEGATVELQTRPR